MTDKEVTSVVNRLTLSPVYKEELLHLLESTKPDGYEGKLTRSGCKTLFLQWIEYARSVVVVLLQLINEFPPHLSIH